MRLSALTDQDRIDHFDRVFIELIGGHHVWLMLVDHFNGNSYSTIANYHDQPKETVRRWVTVAKMKMRSVGLDTSLLEKRVSKMRGQAGETATAGR